MPNTPLPHPSRASQLIGLALLVLGSTTMLGWLLHVPPMVQIVEGLVPMVFNTGLGFALAGACLLLSRRPLLRAAIGCFLIVLCGLTLVEHLTDTSLGIDMAWVHLWHDYGNTRPGRMAPNTAFGFMLIGATQVALRRVESRAAAYAVVILTFCLLTVGLTGLVGYMLAPDLLFGWSRSARMALHTASGMILAAIGIWMGWAGSGWFGSNRFFTEAAKVRLLGTAILIVVTTTVGLTGFVLMQQALEKAIEGKLETVVQSRRTWLMAVTREIVQHAQAELRLVDAAGVAASMLGAPSGPAGAATFDRMARPLIAQAYSHVALEDAQQRVVHELGAYKAPAQFVAELDQDGTQLVWNGMPMLRIRQAVILEGGLAGYVRLDRALDEFDRALFDVRRLGSAAELAACVRQAAQLVCLPNNLNPGIFRIPLGARKLPMEYAVAGQSGVIHAIDYRGQNVVAAFGPVSPGFGFVAKQDAVEAYAVIRNALEFGVPIIVLISMLGAFALYSQMDPLVSRMHASERRAEQSAAEMRTLMHAVGDGILTIDGQGRIRSVNPAASRIFGYGNDELAGRRVTELIPAESRDAHERGVARVMAGEAPRLIGTPNVKVEGQRKDGSRFPLELTVTTVLVEGERQFVGVMRDITERQALEHKLERLAQYDSLTGLANRSLFMDRLRLALKRSERSQCSVAVMFIDLDGFKGVNDSLGHQAGDELLVEVARRMSDAVRSTDTVARLGGDEFTVILEDMKPPARSASTVAGKILDQMQRPFPVGGGHRHIGASIGLVVHDAEGMPADIDEIIRQADARMYAAKQGGKNRIVGPA